MMARKGRLRRHSSRIYLMMSTPMPRTRISVLSLVTGLEDLVDG
jgi:hypothetical protein